MRVQGRDLVPPDSAVVRNGRSAFRLSACSMAANRAAFLTILAAKVEAKVEFRWSRYRAAGLTLHFPQYAVDRRPTQPNRSGYPSDLLAFAFQLADDARMLQRDLHPPALLRSAPPFAVGPGDSLAGPDPLPVQFGFVLGDAHQNVGRQSAGWLDPAASSPPVPPMNADGASWGQVAECF